MKESSKISSSAASASSASFASSLSLFTMNWMKYIIIRGANNKTAVQNNKQTKKEVYRINAEHAYK